MGRSTTILNHEKDTVFNSKHVCFSSSDDLWGNKFRLELFYHSFLPRIGSKLP